MTNLGMLLELLDYHMKERNAHRDTEVRIGPYIPEDITRDQLVAHSRNLVTVEERDGVLYLTTGTA